MFILYQRSFCIQSQIIYLNYIINIIKENILNLVVPSKRYFRMVKNGQETPDIL